MRREKNLSLDVWETYLSSKAEKTKMNYTTALNFFSQLHGLSLLDIPKQKPEKLEEMIVNLIRTLKEKGLAANTIRLYLIAIREFLSLYDVRVNWAKLKALIPKKRVVRELKPIPKEVLLRILPYMNPSRRILIWFLFATGVRVGEALEIKVGDLDLESDPPRCRVVSEKTYQERVVFIPYDLANELKRFIKDKSRDDYLFTTKNGDKLDPKNVRDSFQRALLRFGYLERDRSNKGWTYTIHSLRRSFKTILTNAGMNPLAVELLMGHDIGVSGSYYRPSETELANEWRKYEKYLHLDFAPIPDSKTLAAMRLITLETVWSSINPGQPPEDLYENAARFRLGHYPTIEEKIKILEEAIRTFVTVFRVEERATIREALREAIEESQKQKRRK